ncbi:MAG: ATP-binding cassette domain-containing protein [Chloroflexi bacterium]|nr:ATP-binding cassette domain-containing protein [Chloroflexota bacterium]
MNMLLSEPAIAVAHLGKDYEVSQRAGGMGAALASFFRRRTRLIHAVDDVSFTIGEGEVVGFLGPNGAGKTTTLKMLAGLLHPTGGAASVLGHIPWRREKAYLCQMTLVMGQRNQLYWDLPAMDTLLVNQAIYRLPERQFRETLAELTDLLDLAPLLGAPVRQLSLGERMRCEFAAALIHRPRVVFLDEPTIGLDVTMQERIRRFIREYNRRSGATVLLTSHYMADVTALCRRVIVIHQGRLLYDGALGALTERMAPFKLLAVTLEEGSEPPASWAPFGERVDGGDGQPMGRVQLRVPKDRAAEVTARLLSQLRVADLTVEDPPVEAVIDRVFQGKLDGAVALPAGAHPGRSDDHGHDGTVETSP